MHTRSRTRAWRSLIFVPLILPFLADAQHVNSDRESRVDRVTISSQVLQEKRTIYIHYPQTATNDPVSGYPVLYVLDADTHFSLISEYCDYLSRWDVNVMPEMIVVGITNTDRARDLTPTHTTLDYFGKEDKSPDSWLRSSGGNEKFFQFIQGEVMPYVKSHYQTQPFTIFAGHSFGGITTVNCLLTHPDMFNAYIAASPSFWWDRGYLLKLADKTLLSGSSLNKILFCSDGNEGISDGSAFHTYLVKFDSLLKARAVKGLEYTYSYYPEESHMTVPVKSYQDGLRFIFKDWALPPRPDDQVNATWIADHYRKLSQRYGYTILPNKKNIRDWSTYLMKNTETLDNAISLLEMLAGMYPASPGVFESLGDAYVKKNEKEKAIMSYEKVLSLDAKATGVKEKLKSMR